MQRKAGCEEWLLPPVPSSFPTYAFCPLPSCCVLYFSTPVPFSLLPVETGQDRTGRPLRCCRLPCVPAIPSSFHDPFPSPPLCHGRKFQTCASSLLCMPAMPQEGCLHVQENRRHEPSSHCPGLYHPSFSPAPTLTIPHNCTVFKRRLLLTYEKRGMPFVP